MAQRFNSALWECRIVANTSAFQAEDAGSIPVIPSTFFEAAPLVAIVRETGGAAVLYLAVCCQ